MYTLVHVRYMGVEHKCSFISTPHITNIVPLLFMPSWITLQKIGFIISKFFLHTARKFFQKLNFVPAHNATQFVRHAADSYKLGQI